MIGFRDAAGYRQRHVIHYMKDAGIPLCPVMTVRETSFVLGARKGTEVTNSRNALRLSAGAHPWLFLGLTLVLTWVFEFLAAAVSGSAPQWVVTALRFAGGLMPLVIAVALVLLKHDGSYRRDYWRRLVDLRCIGLGWCAVVFLYTPLKSCVAAVIDFMPGGNGDHARSVEQSIREASIDSCAGRK